MKETFPPLEDCQATKESLHLYALAMSVVPRAHAKFHPQWWHITLKVTPEGLVGNEIKLPDGGSFKLRMDFGKHAVVLETSRGESKEFGMAAGLTATQFGDQILAAVADLGLEGEYEREKFENDEPRAYNKEQAAAFFRVVTIADRVFKKQREGLSGERGPVQLWPHGFDLAFEWFGTRVERHEENGEMQEYPAQLNLGFSPGESSHPAPYFYSNPWPFEGDQLTDKQLPHGARWFTESWQGTLLEYSNLVGDPEAEQKLLEYAQGVYEITSPTLMA